jgi:hypothetical protein
MRGHRVKRPQYTCRAIAKAFEKYGYATMQVRLLGVYPVSILDTEEIKAIAEHQTLAPNGYNLTEGGTGGRVVLTDHARKRMGDSRRGKHCTEAHKVAISKAHTGKVVSDATRAKISAKARGRKQSQETKAKISASGKARNWTPSPEHLAKMNAARKASLLSRSKG